MDGPGTWRRILPRLDKPNHGEQLHCLVGWPLESPLAIIERSVLEQVRAASIKNAALAQNAIHKPAFFQLECCSFECLAFVFGDWHKHVLLAGGYNTITYRAS